MSTSADFDPAGRAPVSMDVRREVREIAEDGYASESELEELDEFAFGSATGLLTHFHSGHVLPDYRKLLAKGWSGFSAYFTGLNLTTQNEIIERTEN
jgi:hypothetical protein